MQFHVEFYETEDGKIPVFRGHYFSSISKAGLLLPMDL